MEQEVSSRACSREPIDKANRVITVGQVETEKIRFYNIDIVYPSKITKERETM